MASCPRCYAVLPAGAKFCPSCSAPVSAPPALAPSPAVVPTPAPVPAAGAGTRPTGRSASAESSPGVPLYPDERVMERYLTDPRAQARIAVASMSYALILVLAIGIPFFALIYFTPPAYNPIAFVMLFPIALVGGMTALVGQRLGKGRPMTVFVTNRRVIVDRADPNPSSVSIGLENLGNVQVDQKGRAARRNGVAWVYLLPLGTTEPFIGSGRYRQPAAGVVWIPAMPVDDAERLRAETLASARELQARLGLGRPTAAPPLGR